MAVMIGVTAAYWIHYRNGAVVSDRLLAQNRAAVYGTLASIFGSLLGFVITAASIVLGFSGSESLAVVRGSKHYPTLWRSLHCLHTGLGLCNGNFGRCARH